MNVVRVSFTVLVLASLIGTTGCDDESDSPTSPSPPEAWREIALPSETEGTVITAIAFGQGSSVALAVDVGARSTAILTEQPGITDPWWGFAPGAESIDGLLVDLTVLPTGAAIAVGIDASLRNPLSVDQRDAWSPQVETTVLGSFRVVERGPSGRIHAVGFGGADAVAAVDCGTGCWQFVDAGFPGDPQEKSILDLAVGDGVLYACGFDDGGEGTPEQPYHLLLENDGAGWTLIDSPCGGCSRYSFDAIAALSDGRLVVGGSLLDYSTPGADQEVAWASLRQSDGSWVDLDIPGAGVLDKVHDIVVGVDGVINLLCDGPGSNLVRIDLEGGTRTELIGADLTLMRLAETPDGTLYAAGFSGSPDAPSPSLVARRP